MASRKKLVPVVDPEATTAPGVLAQSIRDVEQAAKKLLNSGITPEGLSLLICHAMPVDRRVSARTVRDVLDAASQVGARFLVNGPKAGS